MSDNKKYKFSTINGKCRYRRHMHLIMKIATLVLCIASVAMAAPGSWRIIDDENAATEQFPYLVSFRTYGKHFCGGSILDETTIITAAHCVYNSNRFQVTVRVGNNQLNQQIEQYKVSKLTRHEGFTMDTLLNDIAIIKLATPIKFRRGFVEPIKLPQTNIGVNETVIVSGWGWTDFQSIHTPNDLQFIVAQTISLERCALEMSYMYVPVCDFHVCTVTWDGSTICKGDSGGPLVDENRTHIGIASWADEDCVKGKPNVFTSVYYFLNWIEANRR